MSMSPKAFVLDESVELLRRTPAVVSAWVLDLPPAWLELDEGPGTWTARDVLGHLIHGERTDWIPRARLLLAHGTARPFEPFEREGHRRELAGASTATLVRLFAEERARSLAALAELRPSAADLERQGTHPALGTVTLRNLLATWVAHDLGHLAQLARVMAKRYADEVGPWRAYIPVLSDRAKGPAS